MKPREAKSFVRKMRISSNMVLLIQEGSPMAEKPVIDTLAKAIDGMGIKNVLLLVVKDFDKDILFLDKHAMSKHGWFLASDVNSLLRRQNVTSKPQPPTV